MSVLTWREMWNPTVAQPNIAASGADIESKTLMGSCFVLFLFFWLLFYCCRVMNKISAEPSRVKSFLIEIKGS